jgi:hypothetical protein
MILDKSTTILGAVGGVVAIISGLFGAWWKIESTISTSVKASTEVVTKDIESSTLGIATELIEDLKLRLHVTQLDIHDLERQGKVVPERLLMHKELLQDRIKDMEKKWLTPEG